MADYTWQYRGMNNLSAHVPAEMSIAEVAAALGVSRGRAAEYARDGALAYREVPGRHGPSERVVSREHVQALVRARRSGRALYANLRTAGWFTVAELADHAGRSPSTITRAIQAGRVRAIQFRHETGTPYLVNPADLSVLTQSGR